MNKTYYQIIDELEQTGVNREYIQGWMGGYLGNPGREEQRVNDAYNAGYQDGQQKHVDNAGDWRN